MNVPLMNMQNFWVITHANFDLNEGIEDCLAEIFGLYALQYRPLFVRRLRHLVSTWHDSH